MFTVSSTWAQTSQRWDAVAGRDACPVFDAACVVLVLEPPASLGQGQLGVVAPSDDTQAWELLDVLGEHYSLPPDSLSIEGDHLVLSSSHPERTLAEAGIGRPLTPAEVAAASSSGWHELYLSNVLSYRIIHLPFCQICQAVPSSPRYGCRAPNPHTFCRACCVKYAQGILATSHHLRCPFPECSCTLQTEALASVVKKVCAARDARIRQQAVRLARIRKGEEGAELQTLIAGGWRGSSVKPCPRCSVLTYKDGGCPHVTCTVCGAVWDWS